MSTDDNISRISLQIQLAATAVATSFLLIFVPNVETITFTAFLFGFLFPFPFAISGIIIMSFTWEIFASMVFAFSGITFPFKIIAWLLVGGIGRFARSIKTQYFYEFLILGATSSLIFDILVTIPASLFFLGNQDAFLTVLLANLVVGIVFTFSHTISNALIFAFIPLILKALLPILASSYSEFVQIDIDYFAYLDDYSDIIFSSQILLIDKRKLASYLLVFIIIVMLLVAGGYQAVQWQNNQDQNDTDTSTVQITLSIDYDGVISSDEFDLQVSSNLTVFQILNGEAVVNYTTRYYDQPFIQAINHVWENKNLTAHYWVFYINDQYVNTGANHTFVDQNDRIQWRYQ